LPGPTDDYFTYKRWFDQHHDALVLPADCSEPGPAPFEYTNQQTWTLRWFLLLSDEPKVYIRIFEHFAKRSHLLMSQRIHFAYHFGPVVGVDAQGVPLHEPTDPVFVRIDNINMPPHLHPEGEQARHILQQDIKGLILKDLDLFDFVKASLRKRKNGTPMSRELEYRVA
jgi:hypothetical protein